MMKKVAIIGAGFTGLTAGYELIKNGYEVDIYEYSKEIGGLVAGFKTADGYPLEKVYHFLYKTDTDILGLLEELGIRDQLEFHASSISTIYGGKVYPMMTPMDLLKFTPLSIIDRARAGAVVMMLQYKKKWDDLKKVTAYDWMMKWAGKNVVKVIWEPLLRGKFDKYYNKVSMTFLWSRVQVRALSKDKGDVTEKLGYFKGGWITLVEKLIEVIEQGGGKIHTGSLVTDIARDESAKKVTVSVNGERKEFDAIISTTPSYTFSSLVREGQLDQDYLRKVKAVEYIGAVVMPFVSTEEISPYYWHNINDLDIGFLVFLNLTALTGPERFGGKYVYYIGDYIPHDHEYFEMSEEEIANKWFDGLKKIFPSFNRSNVTEHNVFKFKNAQHIADVDYDKEKLLPFRTPVSGVYLSNFSQVYPEDRGTNFAVRDGKRVASEVIEYLHG